MPLHGYYFSEDNDRLHAPYGAVVATFNRVKGRQHPFVELNFPTEEPLSLDDELPLEMAVVPIIRAHRLRTTTHWERFNAWLASFASNGGWQWVGIAVNLALGTVGLWVGLSK